MTAIEIRKENHRRNMQLLAALALEHGLHLLDQNDVRRKVIEQDIIRNH